VTRATNGLVGKVTTNGTHDSSNNAINNETPYGFVKPSAVKNKETLTSKIVSVKATGVSVVDNSVMAKSVSRTVANGVIAGEKPVKPEKPENQRGDSTAGN